MDYTYENKFDSKIVKHELLNKIFKEKIDKILIYHSNKEILLQFKIYLEEIISNEIYNNINNVAFLNSFKINTTTNNILDLSIIKLIDKETLYTKFIFTHKKSELSELLIKHNYNVLILEDKLKLENFNGAIEIVNWYKEYKNPNVKDVYITTKDKNDFYTIYTTKKNNNLNIVTTEIDYFNPWKIFYKPLLENEIKYFWKYNILHEIFAFHLYANFYSYFNLSSNQIVIFDKDGEITYSTITKFNNIVEFLDNYEINHEQIMNFINSNTNDDIYFDSTLYIEKLNANSFLLFYKYNLQTSNIVERILQNNTYDILYRRLLKILNAAPDLIWSKDLEGRYLYVNKAICDKLLLAKNIKEPIGKTDLYFALRERNKNKEDKNWHTFGELCQNSDEIVIRNKKPGKFVEYGNVAGEFLNLDVYKAPLYNKKNEIIGTVGIGRDITEIENNENIINTIINNIPTFVINFENKENNFIIKYFNNNFIKIYSDLDIIACSDIKDTNIFTIFQKNTPITNLIYSAISIKRTVKKLITYNDKKYDCSIVPIKTKLNEVSSYTLSINVISNSDLAQLRMEESENILQSIIDNYDNPVAILKNKSLYNNTFIENFGLYNVTKILNIIKYLKEGEIFEYDEEWYKITNISKVNMDSKNMYSNNPKIIHLENITNIINLQNTLAKKVKEVQKNMNQLNSFANEEIKKTNLLNHINN